MTSTTGPNADPRRRDGFTLLELIVVLVLISTVMALASPSLRRFVRGRSTGDAASHMLALTYLARSEAATGAQVWRLNLDPETGTYWLTAQTEGAFTAPLREYGRVFHLPEGVTVETDAERDSNEPPYVQFYPDGRSDAVIIELTDPEGKVLRLASPSATERFRITAIDEGERLR
jgi:type II secretion system protein H